MSMKNSRGNRVQSSSPWNLYFFCIARHCPWKTHVERLAWWQWAAVFPVIFVFLKKSPGTVHEKLTLKGWPDGSGQPWWQSWSWGGNHRRMVWDSLWTPAPPKTLSSYILPKTDLGRLFFAIVKRLTQVCLSYDSLCVHCPVTLSYLSSIR